MNNNTSFINKQLLQCKFYRIFTLRFTYVSLIHLKPLTPSGICRGTSLVIFFLQRDYLNTIVSSQVAIQRGRMSHSITQCVRKYILNSYKGHYQLYQEWLYRCGTTVQEHFIATVSIQCHQVFTRLLRSYQNVVPWFNLCLSYNQGDGVSIFLIGLQCSTD